MSVDAKTLRKQLAEMRAAGEAKRATITEQTELERLQRELEDEPHIQEAIDTHGAIGDGIAILRTRMGAIVVKRPAQSAWRRFSDGKAITGQESRTLVAACRVYPSMARVDEIVDAYPAALEQVAGLACELAAAGSKEVAAK